MKYIFKYRISMVLLLLAFSACKREDAYKDFVKDGAIIYPGKPLDITAQPGMNRAKLSWHTIDVKVERFHIYWNNKQDSLIVPAVNTGKTADTMHVVIPGLPENDYLFEIVSFDGKGNKSVKEEVSAKVYGQTYVGSLLNRALKKATSMSGTAELYWGTPEQTDVGLEIKYQDNTGSMKTVKVSKTDTLTLLPNYKNGEQFSYRTLFLPDSTAMDTVGSAFVKPAAPVITYPMLDRSKFAPYILPTDALTAWGWTLPMLWDNNTAEGSGFHTSDLPLPSHFTIDLGVTTPLHELKIWQRLVNLYGGGNLRNFEIWGSTSPAADGSYTGWTKLLICESVKPSGQSSGYTPADESYAKAGESFIFPESTPEVRYIRFKIFKTWEGNNPASAHLMEVKFWSK